MAETKKYMRIIFLGKESVMTKNIVRGLLVLSAVSVLLSACESDEEKEIREAKGKFKVLYTYDEDQTRPIVEKKKTVEEMAQDIMLKDVGLDTGIVRFKKKGVAKNQGVFIESAIRDGDKIPKVSAMSKEDADKLKVDNGDEFAEEKKKEFADLRKQRKKVLKDQYKDDSKEEKELEKELKKAVEDQNKKAGKNSD
ncbi:MULTISPECIES: hypothetical protein [Bacillus amyloliquefaciens group]|uniref:hypothetical protein n=1 Tax=Bacillus amyloliquefaciens group TaxID=1938374 RepID=UPI00073BEC18|nr:MULTISPECIES: hypothetical protein [Bacillus amyloliquefaciens group]KTF59782.1 hypothetical protein AR691_13695 [Bacillus amyloliquefaciens]